MKHTKHLIALFLLMGFAVSTYAGEKLDKRYEYTMQKLKLDKATAAKFGPILRKYLEERKAAGDKYDVVKDKYKSNIKAGTLTDAQGKALMDAKLESETLELAAKKKYYAEFKKVLKGNKIYQAFDYANDKKSKIEQGK